MFLSGVSWEERGEGVVAQADGSVIVDGQPVLSRNYWLSLRHFILYSER